MKKIFKILFVFLIITTFGKAQNLDSLRVDSIKSAGEEVLHKAEMIQDDFIEPGTIIKKDSVRNKKAFKPDPVKVVWMGAIIPGYGQILNRSYWKLPLVYAGFIGCAYAINWNARRYTTYKQAYLDISDNDDTTASYLDLIPKGYTIADYGGTSTFQSNLQSAYENYRRYRDLSIIASVAYYAVVLVEAYVDAQLFDFDISSDLSLHVRPALLDNKYSYTKTPGVQFSLNLK
ncbi:MAG: DUF5683 domain-containing protein [Paludibacter sp.]|nr:DUF5683 domain-containing protein [Paludibacter sp.]